jgi:hypothetical protein
MSPYERILEITRTQASAAAAGDLQTAISLLDQRGELIVSAPRPSADDQKLIPLILELEKDISTAFRLRMLAIRDQVLSNRVGQQALAGYAGDSRSGARLISRNA